MIVFGKLIIEIGVIEITPIFFYFIDDRTE